MFIFDKAVFIRKSQVIKAVLFRVVCIGSGSVVNIEPYPARFRQCFHGNGNLIPDAEAFSGSKASQVNRKAFPILVKIRCQGFGRSRGACLGIILERIFNILNIGQHHIRSGFARVIEGILNPDIFQGKLVAAVCLPGNRIGDGIASVLIANRIGRGFVQAKSRFRFQISRCLVLRIGTGIGLGLVGNQLAVAVLNKGIAVVQQDPVAEGTGFVGGHVADLPHKVTGPIQHDCTVFFSCGNGFPRAACAGERFSSLTDTNVADVIGVGAEVVNHPHLRAAVRSGSDG